MMPTVLERRYEHLLPSIERNPYLPADRPQGFFIAINLFNSKAVIPHLFQTLLSISALLGPSNVHIAIFENGSWDETVPAMAHFARALTALGETSHTPLSLSALAYQVYKVSILSLSKGVAHSIRSDAHQTDWEHVDRIAQLAEYRNVALQPLTDFDLSSPNGKPIFNPPFVISSPSDRSDGRLVHQRHLRLPDGHSRAASSEEVPGCQRNVWVGLEGGSGGVDVEVVEGMAFEELSILR
jgi:hypothetical protein